MRAAVLPAIGEKVEFYEDIDVVGPGAGEVRIRVHASGVCHSDLSGQ
ncbi:MAG: Zn-dependent alcohol dehydrogenase, partial [Actinobacteria bacterium]